MNHDPRNPSRCSIQPGKLPLNNTGDEITLIDPDGNIRHRVTDSAEDVVPGQMILFS